MVDKLDATPAPQKRGGEGIRGGADVVIDDGAVVEGGVLLPGVWIGKGAVVPKAILDKNVVVADGAQVGVDLEADRERYTVSTGVVIVLGKGAQV